MRLTRAQKDMLHELGKGPKLALHYTASGGKTWKQLMDKGLIRTCDDPDVIDRRSGMPAQAFELTDAGQAIACGESPELNNALEILLGKTSTKSVTLDAKSLAALARSSKK